MSKSETELEMILFEGRINIYMTKKEVKQLLPFNTITKCEKEYHRLVQNCFSFKGFDNAAYDIVKSCVHAIYSSLWNDSIAQLEKFFAGKENRKKSYTAWINVENTEEKMNAIDLLW